MVQNQIFLKFYRADMYVFTLHHNNIPVTKFVTCLNFASTGSRILLHSVSLCRAPLAKNHIEFQRGNKILGTSSEALVGSFDSNYHNLPNSQHA